MCNGNGKASVSFRNDRSGEAINVEASKDELLARFNETAGNDNWLWFWLAKHYQRNQPREQVNTHRDMLAFLADSFVLAIGMGLQRPMIRLHYKSRRYKVYLSAKGTLCIKSGGLAPAGHYHKPDRFHEDCKGCTDDVALWGQPHYKGHNAKPQGNEEYVGCLYDGRFLPSDRRTFLPEEREFIERMSADPVGFMAECSKDMDRCCYCNKPLEDKRSKDVGYGGVCARRYGLPWGKTYDEKVPSFAQLWQNSKADDQRSIRALCQAIRTNPRDQLAWEALADVLQDNGYLARPSMPERYAVMPTGK